MPGHDQTESNGETDTIAHLLGDNTTPTTDLVLATYTLPTDFIGPAPTTEGVTTKYLLTTGANSRP